MPTKIFVARVQFCDWFCDTVKSDTVDPVLSSFIYETTQMVMSIFKVPGKGRQIISNCYTMCHNIIFAEVWCVVGARRKTTLMFCRI
jgi:hypothetical protein